jgi:hypothetical protein
VFACTKKTVEVPSYIHIQPFTFTTNLLLEGNPSADITDAYVYVNGKYYGIFELPATVPVLAEGQSTILLLPTIKENGAAANRQIIRTLEGFETQVELSKTQVDTIKPNTKYKPNVKFAWLEDYETQVVSTTRAPKSTHQDSIQIIDSNDPNAFPSEFSKFSGRLKVKPTAERVLIEQVTVEKFLVPRGGQDVYFEMDYKTNIPLQIGIYADKPDIYEQIPFIILMPNEKWNKTYLNLKIETSALPANSPIQIFMGFIKSDTDSTISPEIYLDNLKLNYLD